MFDILRRYTVFMSIGKYVSVKKGSFLLYCTLILFLSLPQGVHSLTSFKIIQSNLIRDYNGIFHIVGEVLNKSDKAMKEIVVSATVYNNEGNQIRVFKNLIPVRILNDGKSSPFDILLLENDRIGKISNYTLGITGTPAKSKQSALSVTAVNSRPDILGFYYINGQILNGGLESSSNSLVIASFYDDEGKILAVSSAITEPANVSSRSHASFGIVMNDKSQVPKIGNYSLIIDSDQYIS